MALPPAAILVPLLANPQRLSLLSLLLLLLLLLFYLLKKKNKIKSLWRACDCSSQDRRQDHANGANRCNIWTTKLANWQAMEKKSRIERPRNRLSNTLSIFGSFIFHQFCKVENTMEMEGRIILHFFSSFSSSSSRSLARR